MPVIRGPVKGPSLTDDQRKGLLARLENELSGKSSASEKTVWEVPLIFEMPLDRLDGPPDRMDVLVVWDALEGLRSEERSALILDAYHDQADKIIQALGVTREEAMDQCVLPYRMMHLDRPGEVDQDAITKAMLDEGGFLVGDRAELLLPTRRIAEAALDRLNNRIPEGRWAIGEFVN